MASIVYRIGAGCALTFDVSQQDPKVVANTTFNFASQGSALRFQVRGGLIVIAIAHTRQTGPSDAPLSPRGDSWDPSIVNASDLHPAGHLRQGDEHAFEFGKLACHS